MRKVSPEGCGDKGMKTGCAHSPNPSSSRQSTWSRTVRAAGRIPAARRATRCTPSGASSGATSCGCRIFGGGLGGNGAGRVFDERGVRGSERWSEYPIKNFVFSAMNPSATTHRKVISPSSGLGASFSASARGVSGCSSTLRAHSMIAKQHTFLSLGLRGSAKRVGDWSLESLSICACGVPDASSLPPGNPRKTRSYSCRTRNWQSSR